MIGYLTGTVLKIRPRKLILIVGGIGYEIFTNQCLLTKIAPGEKLEVWIHTHQTNDSISLFGFITERELDFFELLNSVNGVGPKTALDILETPVETIENTIIAGDTKILGKTKGIGAKTAARVVLELRSKITGQKPEVPQNFEINQEAVDALATLGYRKSDVKKTLIQLPVEISETEEIIKWFLKNA